MFFRYFVCFVFLVCMLALLVQNDFYDFSQYKVCYEWWLGFLFDSCVLIGGFYDRIRRLNNDFGIFLWGNGFFNCFMDMVIVINLIWLMFSFNVDFRNNFLFVQFFLIEIIYSLEVDLFMSWFFYKFGSNKFWGWSGGFDVI